MADKMINKSEIKKEYKEKVPTMGVYKITNLVNGKIFIAGSLNIPARINRHKFELKFGSEGIKELQSDYNQFGEDNIKFEILDELKPKDEPGTDYKEEVELLEQMWTEKLQPYGEKGYNERSK